MELSPASDGLPVVLLQRWCDLALDALGAAREEIDALNVYPVPDGDTGTNLYLTFEAARQSLVDEAPTGLADALPRFARGALLGARGNSGVILAQLLRAGSEQLLAGDLRHPGALLADTLSLAAKAAYDAVGEPVEGTILTVARAAAEAAQAALAELPEQPFGQLGTVIRAAARGARDALERTPDLLPTLKAAGVVDAGGRGLCVLLDAAEEALTGRRPVAQVRHLALPVRVPPGSDLSAEGPAYEVMYLLDADDEPVRELRRRLAALGDSLVVVGGGGLWNVHVHVDDVGAAIEAGIEAGHPHRVSVTHFADQIGRDPRWRSISQSGRGVVAVAAGPGLAGLFRDADAVVLERRGARFSTGDILAAIRSAGTAEVIVLPNDPDSIAAAEVAARTAAEEGLRVAVIPTRAQVQGLAAVAVREPGRPFDADVVAMTAAAGHARHGAVTVAARDAMTMAGPCRTGDSLGIVEGDFARVGGDLRDVALDVVERLLAGGGELVTLVTGDGGDELAPYIEETLNAQRPDVEVVTYSGGQPRYPLLIGVE